METAQINITEVASPKNAATIDKEGLTGNTYSKQEVIEVVDSKTTAIAVGFQKSINPATPTPTGGWLKGVYPAQSSGTYVNAGNIVVDISEGFNSLIYDGVVWTKIVTPIQNASETVEIPFSSVIQMNHKKSISKKTLSGNITYSYEATGAMPDSQRCDEIVPNGYSIDFDSSTITAKIQSDIDYTKPISILFIKPLTGNLKIFAVVVNISDIDTSIALPKYRVNPAGGSLINTWIEWVEFDSHVVTSDDCIYNVGYFNYNGVNYITGNFTKVGGGAAQRWASFTLKATEWEAGKILLPDGVDIVGVKVKLGSVIPNQLIEANTYNFTLVQI